MEEKKNTRGGARRGAGRKPQTPGEVRATFTCRVSPETKRTIADLRARGVNIGELLDRAVKRESLADFMRDFETRNEA